MNSVLYYNTPAVEWEEALPIGCGNSGAMVYTGKPKMKIQLNEISLWNSRQYKNPDRTDAYKHLPEVRNLINNKQYKKAEALLDREFTDAVGGFEDGYSGSYQTFGELKIMVENYDSKKVKSVETKLDLSNSLLTDMIECKDVVFTRECFASHPRGILFFRLKSSIPVNYTLKYEREDLELYYSSPDGVQFSGHCEKNSEHMAFAGCYRITQTDGKIGVCDGGVCVTQTTDTVIAIALATDYICSQEKDFKEGNPSVKVNAMLSAIDGISYSELINEAIADYARYFNRFSLDIACENFDAVPTDERLRRHANQKNVDIGLSALLFNYGRYLLISCSREDNILPANLQGLWCKDYKAPWHCDYHSNINIQMNYWPAGPANLLECTRPLANLIKALPENGAKTAQAYFNAPGWTLYTITNPRLWTSPGWGGCWSQYPLGGAWMCKHLIEYYNFSGDLSLLEEFYDTIKSNCEFNLSILYEREDGKYITNPATSPENCFRDDDGNESWVCRGTAMDLEMLYENFTDVIRICELLNRDADFAERVKTALGKLAPLTIGKAGQLCEWEGDWDLNAPEIHHRHVSHLFGLHPGSMISREKTPELAKACEKTLEIRGDDGTGWSLAWKINFYARLGNGEKALSLINRLLIPIAEKKVGYSGGGGVYRNLFDAHPPFQIDGNFGMVSGVCEMLLQSQVLIDNNTFLINPLPALPASWPSGYVRGILARGGNTVDIKWDNSAVSSLTIKSVKGDNIAVKGEYLCPGCSCFTENGITYIMADKGSEFTLIPKK